MHAKKISLRKKASKDLVTINVQFKRELEKKAKEATEHRRDASNKQFKIDHLKASVAMLEQNNSELASDKARLADDNRDLEEEVRTLRAKLASMEEALNSPRWVFEFHSPVGELEMRKILSKDFKGAARMALIRALK